LQPAAFEAFADSKTGQNVIRAAAMNFKGVLIRDRRAQDGCAFPEIAVDEK
jgi:hypothetical protein